MVYIFLICLLFQILLTAPCIRFLFKIFFSKYATLHFRGFGIFPFFIFYFWEFRFLFHGDKKLDRVYFHSKYIRFRLSIWKLLQCRILLLNSKLVTPNLHYHNRSPEEAQHKALPKAKQIVIKNLNIDEGVVFIEDQRKWPVYRFALNDLNVTNLNVDFANPTLMLFQTEIGKARLAGGQINISNPYIFSQKVDSEILKDSWDYIKKGNIQLWGIDWKEFINLKSILPLTGLHLGLSAQFFLYQDNSKIPYIEARGVLGSTNKEIANLDMLEDEDVAGFSFHFNTLTKDLEGTMNMGIQKLIELMVRNAAKRFFKIDLLRSGLGLFNLTKDTNK